MSSRLLKSVSEPEPGDSATWCSARAAAFLARLPLMRVEELVRQRMIRTDRIQAKTVVLLEDVQRHARIILEQSAIGAP